MLEQPNDYCQFALDWLVRIVFYLNTYGFNENKKFKTKVLNTIIYKLSLKNETVSLYRLKTIRRVQFIVL